jgi:hypothetical protein
MEFQVYKLEWKSRKQFSSDPIKELINCISGNSKFYKNKRWIADCPICGKLYFASTNKKDIQRWIKSMNKKYKVGKMKRIKIKKEK